MFGLFKKDSPSAKVNDQIWMSSDAKWNACKKMQAVNPGCLWVAWFEATASELLAHVPGANVMIAEKINAPLNDKSMIIFVEHFPIAEREQNLFLRMNLTEVPVLSSLDEPLFQLFGGERTIKIMQRLGTKDDEVISHSMITKSINRAQAKIKSVVRYVKPATSAKEWFELNYPRK